MQGVLLVIAGWQNLHQLNPDAIAYARIADYYAQGKWELAVTGYWGPLLSWFMVPWLKLGVAPLAAARVVMALSAVVFLCGALAVFRAFRLPRVALLTGAWLAAGWSVFWSVRNITPDLLLAGLVSLAVSATLRGSLAPGKQRTLMSAGAWWGLAYLAKAVALPLAGLTVAGLILFALRNRPPNGKRLDTPLIGRLAMVWAGSALLAGPWIGVLSLHYGKFTFSTTGPIAHALAGPDPRARYHPAMVTLHLPEAGRVTQWEEPSRMPYRRWSPFTSGDNFTHQLNVVSGNLGVLWQWLSPWGTWISPADLPLWRRWLSTSDLLGLSAVAVVLAGWHLVKCWNHRQRWSLAAVPLVCLGALYLPFWVQAEDQRYFYPAFPFLWVLAVGGWGWFTRQGRQSRHTRQIGFRVLSMSFTVPALIWGAAALHSLPNPASLAAKELALQLKTNGYGGPIAGSALLPGGRTGLYTAFLLGERWLGDDPQAGAAEFRAAGARCVLLRRDSAMADAFARDPHWRPMAGRIPATLLVFLRIEP